MRATLGMLAAIAKRLAAAGSDREALETLRREAHKIHGSAGSFGFMEASRLAAGMEVTAKDWVARPGDTDMDRGGLAGWFVTRLAEMLKLEVPEAPPPPPRLIIRRPSAAQKAAASPAPPSKPLAPATRPEPPHASPPRPRVAPVVPRRPSQPQSAPRPTPPALTPPAPNPPPKAAPSPRPKAAPQPPPQSAPTPPPKVEPKPPPTPPQAADGESIPWLVSPEESTPAKRPPAATPPKPPPQVVQPPPPRAPPLPPATVKPSPPPVVEQRPVVESPPTAPPPVPEAAPTVPEIILVEDDPALADLLEYGLRARGYRFLSYRNGSDALRELLALEVAGTRPVVLLDVDLPGLDGYSVLDALERGRPGAFRVVFTTVHGGEAEQLRGLEAGALDYLVKPISLRVALEKIRRWVGR
ncbi:MAG: hypothetical protein AUI55_01235 [Gemmatimonadetes bacterium 13_1_40CM_2_70_7]|nr:MAG: hypothetical protein AUI55_01235 [Gemmatimonadetes bacterium 13_1_40CM_2_70_7]